MFSRITFFSIGRTPRGDLVPEIAARLPASVEIAEVGALDGLSREVIEGLEPGPGEEALVTRLPDGTQVVLSKRWVQQRLQALLDATGGAPSDESAPRGAGAGAASDEPTVSTRPADQTINVLLCTGRFPGLRGPWPFLDARHLVDHGVAAICGRAGSIGLLIPLERQEAELHYEPPDGQELVIAHASPYEDEDFEAADFEAVGRSLAACDLVVMHCMGYTEAQRAAVARGSGGPVLLARRMVAAGLAQLL